MKSKQNLNIRGGVLVIGSLLWQDDLNPNDKVRKSWRNNRLSIEQGILVKTPIRYGRLSKSGIYTMTFSNSCIKKQGTAFAIPFRQKKFDSVEEIIYEGKELSKAEGMDGNFMSSGKTNSPWGVLGILLNPNNIDKNRIKSIIKGWSESMAREGILNNKIFKLQSEKPAIKTTGELNIKWPMVVDVRQKDDFNKFDFLLATVTRPTDYPSITKLKATVLKDKTRYYFIQNFKNGITTFQDIGVINQLTN